MRSHALSQLPHLPKAFDGRKHSRRIHFNLSKAHTVAIIHQITVSACEKAIAPSDISIWFHQIKITNRKTKFCYNKIKIANRKTKFCYNKIKIANRKTKFCYNGIKFTNRKTKFRYNGIKYCNFAADCGLTPQGIRHLDFRGSDHPNQTSN